MSLPTLLRTATAVLHPDDAPCMLDRMRYANFDFQGMPEGSVFRMRERCMPGDPVMVHLFAVAYAHGIQMHLGAEALSFASATSPITMQNEQVCMVLFVDDLADAFEFRSYSEAPVGSRAQNGRVDGATGEMGLQQN
eukprot:9497766-Pyramimonas_sp.AAC.1